MSRSRRLSSFGAAGGLIVLLVVLFAVPGRDLSRAVARSGHGPPPPELVGVALAAEPAIPVPASFLGISTEYSALATYARYPVLAARVLGLLEAPGAGPLMLRIGGDTADRTIWNPDGRRLPRWAIDLTPRELRRLALIVGADRLRTLIDLNLVTGSPWLDATWARAAKAYLPAGSIAGFEIGNEPDLYDHRYWMQSLGAAVGGMHNLPAELRAAGYVNDFETYGAAISGLVPGVPLVGPEIATPVMHAEWLRALLRAPHPGLGLVSAHRYPYSACAHPGTHAYPTIARLLSERATAGLASAVAPAARTAHAAGLPFRLTELNSVTCRGRRGVSDSFATALWAPDALFELLRAGVDGVNVHVNPGAVNEAFAINAGGLDARPLLYGLVAFSHALGARAQLVALRVRERPAAHVKVWAVRVAGGQLNVVVIDKGTRPAAVELRLPARGPAIVERLTAPSAAARSGVTLDGQSLTRAGRWQGTRSVEVIRPTARGYAVFVPRMSLALVHLTSSHR